MVLLPPIEKPVTPMRPASMSGLAASQRKARMRSGTVVPVGTGRRSAGQPRGVKWSTSRAAMPASWSRAARIAS